MRRVSVVLCCIAACQLLAQQDSGTILGSVRDAQDAVVTSAEVSIRNIDTGVVKNTPVTSTGGYSVPFLVPGNYSVTAAASGFKKTVRTGIRLRVADQLVIDMRLEIGAVSESVTVEATAPLVDSANITLATVKQMMDALHVGPILLGTDRPAHILTPSVTSRGIVNMTALAVVEAAQRAQVS